MSTHMKINFADIDRDEFVVREHLVAGETVNLVFPMSPMTTWSKSNLHFRSSVWTADGELVSAGFKKFFNWNEKPKLTYTPFSMTANGGISIMEKMDGSLLICSMYKGQWIARTRGTIDARQLDNGYEIEPLMEKYKGLFTQQANWATNGTLPWSFLFEWVTPKNRIVIDHEEPDLVLVGVIDHLDYNMWSQENLDLLASNNGLRRPRRFEFDSLKDMLEKVPAWEGDEGICVYCNGGQDIRKLKSEWYLKIHRMKAEMDSFRRVADVYFEFGCPEHAQFVEQLDAVYDYEIISRIDGSVRACCRLYREVQMELNFLRKVLNEDIVSISERRDQATKIFAEHKDRAGVLFSLLDGTEVNERKLFDEFYADCVKRDGHLLLRLPDHPDLNWRERMHFYEDIETGEFHFCYDEGEWGGPYKTLKECQTSFGAYCEMWK